MTSTPAGRAVEHAILVVDDDPRIRFLVRRILEQAGYEVRVAGDAVEAERAVRAATPDLVLLDVALPHASGAELLRGWRERGLQMPVVILTAHGDAEREAALLEAGADDYLDKPFEPRVLTARVANALRRAGAIGASPTPWGATPAGTAPAEGDVFAAGPLTLRVRERLVVVGERRAPLTRTETALLRELLQTPGVVRLYDDLLTRVWGPSYVGQVELLHTNVYRLRRKLEEDPSHPVLLVATSGVGYCLLPEPAAGG